jgi:hypothetical protein
MELLGLPEAGREKTRFFENNPAHILVFDFQLPEPQDKTFLLF